MTGFIYIYYVKEVNANATILVRQKFFYLEERIIIMRNLLIALEDAVLDKSSSKQTENLAVISKRCAPYDWSEKKQAHT